MNGKASRPPLSYFVYRELRRKWWQYAAAVIVSAFALCIVFCLVFRPAGVQYLIWAAISFAIAVLGTALGLRSTAQEYKAGQRTDYSD